MKVVENVALPICDPHLRHPYQKVSYGGMNHSRGNHSFTYFVFLDGKRAALPPGERPESGEEAPAKGRARRRLGMTARRLIEFRSSAKVSQPMPLFRYRTTWKRKSLQALIRRFQSDLMPSTISRSLYGFPQLGTWSKRFGIDVLS